MSADPPDDLAPRVRLHTQLGVAVALVLASGPGCHRTYVVSRADLDTAWAVARQDAIAEATFRREHEAAPPPKPRTRRPRPAPAFTPSARYLPGRDEDGDETRLDMGSVVRGHVHAADPGSAEATVDVFDARRVLWGIGTTLAVLGVGLTIWTAVYFSDHYEYSVPPFVLGGGAGLTGLGLIWGGTVAKAGRADEGATLISPTSPVPNAPPTLAPELPEPAPEE